MKAYLTGAFLALMAATASAGEDTELRALITANDTRGWEAVGRINFGSSGFCTGALIAPDVVLTAAHCLFDPDSHNRVRIEEIEFLAGWRNGRATAYRAVRGALIHPDYEYQGPQGSDFVAEDVALLKLDRPIRKSSVTPFETTEWPRKGTQVGVVSYARHRATRPSLQEACNVLGRPGGTLVLSCDVDFGSSGAPVFVVEDGEPRIVSVISAKAEISGRAVSLGTTLGADLEEMRAALDTGTASGSGTARVANRTAPAATPVVRRTPASSSAKFLRP